MTAHDVLVIVTGLAFMAAAAGSGLIWRVLGPTYHTKTSAPWMVRGFFAVSTLVLAWRGLALIFPGPQTHTGLMSPVVPATAFVMVGFVVFILDIVLRDRAPPPLLGRVLRLAARRGVDDETLKAMAFAGPIAAYDNVGSTPQGDGRERAVVLVLCGLILAALGAGFALQAAAAT